MLIWGIVISSKDELYLFTNLCFAITFCISITRKDWIETLSQVFSCGYYEILRTFLLNTSGRLFLKLLLRTAKKT